MGRGQWSQRSLRSHGHDSLYNHGHIFWLNFWCLPQQTMILNRRLLGSGHIGANTWMLFSFLSGWPTWSMRTASLCVQRRVWINIQSPPMNTRRNQGCLTDYPQSISVHVGMHVWVSWRRRRHKCTGGLPVFSIFEISGDICVVQSCHYHQLAPFWGVVM
jgi:hypothetical protein